MAVALIIDSRYQTNSMAITTAGHLILQTDHGLMRFEEVFKSHFKSLHAYAFTIVKDDMLAEEMVQNVFCKLWEKKDRLQINSSATAYLYRSVYHECLNYLKHQKVQSAYHAFMAARPADEPAPAAAKLQMGELEWHLNKALNELPEQCRTIFQMSRFEELKYQEIADRLGLSIKTIENQMGKALRLLREKLSEFLPLILLILLNI